MVSGRVVSINARLGDTVIKGQLMLTVRSDDTSGGFSDYRKAVEDEILANKQLVRTRDLYSHGAMALSDVENTEDTENKARVDVETFAEHLRLLGNDPDHPNVNVEIFAPVGGIVTDQEVTNAANVQSFGTNPFTISDLSYVWIICDVYENDLATVKLGDTAGYSPESAYPNQVFRGTVSNIGAIMDPNIRTAKVRLGGSESRKHAPRHVRQSYVQRPDHGDAYDLQAAWPPLCTCTIMTSYSVPPLRSRSFRRVEVISGDLLPGQHEPVAGDQVGT